MRSIALPALFLGAALFSACTDAPAPAASAPAQEVAILLEPGPAAEAAMAIEASMSEHRIPGMSVAVIRDGEIVWSEAFGVANLETGARVTRDTRFRLASLSKLFAADIAAMLAEEGALDLDEDIRAYVPAFPDKGAPITLRQLLGHLAGIRSYLPKDTDPAQPGGAIDTRPYPDAAAILAIFADDPLLAPPGEAYAYSTFGYSLAELVLEAAAGRRFEELLHEKILAPAGIEDVAVDDMFAIVPNRTEFYSSREEYPELSADRYGPVVNASPLNSAYKIAGGGLVGDAEAVAAYGALHLAPGFFSDAVFTEIFTRQHTNAGEELGVGLGWRNEKDDKGRTLFHHSGSQQGSRAHLSVYPEEGLSIAILSNMNNPRDVHGLAGAIAEPFLNNAKN